MSIKRGLFSVLGLALLAIGIQLPAKAQMTAPEAASINQPTISSDENLTAENLAAENLAAENLEGTTDGVVSRRSQPVTEADALDFPADGAAVDIAQARRRTSGNMSSANFIGVGADFGTGSDTSFAVISKFALSENISVRPTVLIGDDFAALVPVTYEFSQYSAEVGSFQIRPYIGAGASYVDQSGGSDFGALVSAGIDVPVSRQFTGNVQANYAGIFSDDSNFGVTVGVGYNFGGL